MTKVRYLILIVLVSTLGTYTMNQKISKLRYHQNHKPENKSGFAMTATAVGVGTFAAVNTYYSYISGFDFARPPLPNYSNNYHCFWGEDYKKPKVNPYLIAGSMTAMTPLIECMIIGKGLGLGPTGFFLCFQAAAAISGYLIAPGKNK